MSYQVLARKLRPGVFGDLVGQEHVVRTLTHALDSGRVHHAYLFTGTRGVGKTTVARILARCLNCEQGVSSRPCGECSACREITEGRFIDLLELDAASRTGVDAMRELIENAQYRPAYGRFKVYLIDEVHMLSTSSFNALLKTLEEPPEHVKFLLATTDPKKVPVTVLSRCLQFQLKNLPQERIAAYLAEVLTKEDIGFEAPAVEQIARAARGSMRDALSLTDQGIAYGGGRLSAQDVADMLGSVRGDDLSGLLDAIVAADAAAALGVIATLAENGADFESVLEALIDVLHRVAVAQAVPDAGAEEAIAELAGRLEPAAVQLYYQIALITRRDLPLAPDPRVGFEMGVLRMLTFVPLEPPPDDDREHPASTGASGTASSGRVPRGARGQGGEAARSRRGPTAQGPNAAPPAVPADDAWYALVAALDVAGVTRMIVEHTVPLEQNDRRWVLCLDQAHDTLLNESQRARLEAAIGAGIGRAIDLEIRLGPPPAETPAGRNERTRRERQERALAALEADATVRSLISELDAELELESVKPVDGQEQS